MSTMRASNLEASEQPELIALCTVMLSLATLAVLLRCWFVFVSPTHLFGLDDFFAIIALPFVVVETSLIYWWISLGLGRHASTLPIENLKQGPKIIFVAAFFYDAGIALPKFSALFFYYRIFRRTSQWFYVALRVVGAANAAWLVAAFFSTLFQCVPVKKSWTTVNGGHCFSQPPWFLGTAIPSTLIDLCILLMPLPMLWKLQASRTKKLMFSGVFLIGYSVVIVSIGRLISVSKAVAVLEDDLTWSTLTYLKWVQCEGPLSIISVCLPNIISLGTLIRTHGRRSLFRAGKSQRDRPYLPDSADNDKRFIRMETQPRHGEALHWGRSEELDPEREYGESVSLALVGLHQQRSAEPVGV